jgi:diguanylate cyclase (GGDEF)-like protein
MEAMPCGLQSGEPLDAKTSVEVRRSADQDLIARAVIGIGVYPVLLLLLGTSVPFRAEHAEVFWSCCTAIAASFCARLFLLWCAQHARLPLRRYWMPVLLATIPAVAGTTGWLSLGVLRWYGFGTWTFTTVMLWLIGIACGSTITFTPNRCMMYLNIALLLGPPTAYGFWLGSREMVTIAVAALVLVAYLALQGHRLHRMYWDLLVEHATRKQQAEELHAARLAAEAAREAMHFQATHDSLTGLWNHAEILEFLEREVRRAARTQNPLGLLMLDIDHFKRINDLYGHLTGDDVLKEVATRLPASVRSCDGVGRYGGEEFFLVLPDCEPRQLQAAAERIRADIASHTVRAFAGPLSVTVSIGCSAGRATAADSAEDLLRAADEAMYDAKNAGRNRVSVRLVGGLSTETVDAGFVVSRPFPSGCH